MGTSSSSGADQDLRWHPSDDADTGRFQTRYSLESRRRSSSGAGWRGFRQHGFCGGYGGRLIGICGGFQMLGHQVHDPLGLEGDRGSTRGLGFLDMETRLEPEKQLRNVRGLLAIDDASVRGYEIHAGVTEGPALAHPVAFLDTHCDGALSDDGRVLGTYLHGLFDSAHAGAALLRWAGLRGGRRTDYCGLREAAIDRLADAVEQHLDTGKLWGLLDPTRQGV